MNKTLSELGRQKLKELLPHCTTSQQNLFRRMYSNNPAEPIISKVVDDMDDDKIDHAITQCERTVINNMGG